MASIFYNRALNRNWSSQQKSQERLSSGSRITHGGDDGAGLSIAERDRAAIRSLGMANRNIEDGFSIVNTADGALTQVTNDLARIRELAIQAASDTIGATERAMVEKEVQQLKQEIS